MIGPIWLELEGAVSLEIQAGEPAEAVPFISARSAYISAEELGWERVAMYGFPAHPSALHIRRHVAAAEWREQFEASVASKGRHPGSGKCNERPQGNGGRTAVLRATVHTQG